MRRSVLLLGLMGLGCSPIPPDVRPQPQQYLCIVTDTIPVGVTTNADGSYVVLPAARHVCVKWPLAPTDGTARSS